MTTAKILRPGHKLRPPSSVKVAEKEAHDEKITGENNPPSESALNDEATNSIDEGNSKYSLDTPAIALRTDAPQCSDDADDLKNEGSPPRNDAFKSLMKRDVRNNNEPLKQPAAVAVGKAPACNSIPNSRAQAFKDAKAINKKPLREKKTSGNRTKKPNYNQKYGRLEQNTRAQQMRSSSTSSNPNNGISQHERAKNAWASVQSNATTQHKRFDGMISHLDDGNEPSSAYGYKGAIRRERAKRNTPKTSLETEIEEVLALFAGVEVGCLSQATYPLPIESVEGDAHVTDVRESPLDEVGHDLLDSFMDHTEWTNEEARLAGRVLSRMELEEKSGNRRVEYQHYLSIVNAYAKVTADDEMASYRAENLLDHMSRRAEEDNRPDLRIDRLSVNTVLGAKVKSSSITDLSDALTNVAVGEART